MCLYKISLVGLLMNCASYSFGLNIFGDAGFSSFTYERCQRLCVYASACASFDWNKETRVCQLNRDSSERNENTHPVSINTISAKEGPCMKRPCSSLHVCVPVASSTDYRCLPIGQTTTATTSATPSATSATTTTAEREAATTTPSTTTTFEATTERAGETTSSTTTAAAATERASETTSSTTTTAAAAAATERASETTSSTTTTAAAATERASETTSSTTTTATATTTRSNKPCLHVDDSCTDEHCRCSIGCGFDKQTRRCREMTLEECLELDNTFEEYTGHYIKEHNEHSGRFQNCTEECISRNCSTYDRKANEKCYIKQVFWYDVEERKRETSRSGTHFQRNCKTWR